MKVRTISKPDGGRYGLAFCCPGCKTHHMVNVDEGRLPRWDWNGSKDTPTFNPSIKSIVHVDGEARCCHSFVRDGNIQFLNDCTHDLKGQTVPLPDIEQ